MKNMQRKVIQLAKKTLVVSLPSKWAKENNVKKGDDVEVEPEEKRLIINIDKELKGEKITINAEDLGSFDPLYIAYLYQGGIDEVKIKYKDRSVYSKTQQKLPDLMGFEIVNQGEDYMEVKNVSNALNEEFETLMRRAYYILEDMGKSSFEAIKEKNFSRLKDLLPLENSVDKFTDFCKRVLIKKGYKNPKKTPFYYAIIRDVEKIGDYYEEIMNYEIENKIEICKETEKLYEESNEFLQLFHQLFYKFDKEKASEFQKKKKELRARAEALMKKVKREELFIVYNLLGLIRMTGNLYGPYYITLI